MRTVALGARLWLAMSTPGTHMWRPDVGSKKQRLVNTCRCRCRDV